jgi:hypothetical protein
VHIFLKSILRGGAALLVGGALVSCVTTPSADSQAKNIGPLKLNPPKMRSDQDPKKVREKWVSIKLPGGLVFAQAKDGMDDVISMSAEESNAGAAVKSLDDVEVIISNGVKFEKKRRTEVLGEPCIRYERVTESTTGENPTVKQALAAPSRSMAGPFYVRTLGCVFMHPGKPGSYITLTCSRTSYHGQIGDYYEELFDDFLGAFVVDNCVKPQAYQPL